MTLFHVVNGFCVIWMSFACHTMWAVGLQAARQRQVVAAEGAVRETGHGGAAREG